MSFRSLSSGSVTSQTIGKPFLYLTLLFSVGESFHTNTSLFQVPIFSTRCPPLQKRDTGLALTAQSFPNSGEGTKRRARETNRQHLPGFSLFPKEYLMP